jgi:hypothetical protein
VMTRLRRVAGGGPAEQLHPKPELGCSPDLGTLDRHRDIQRLSPGPRPGARHEAVLTSMFGDIGLVEGLTRCRTLYCLDPTTLYEGHSPRST